MENTESIDISLVRIVQNGKTVRELTLEQYLELPMKVKVKSLLAGEFVFISRGKQIPAIVATKHLRKIAR